MELDLLTRTDLEEFEKKLLEEIKGMLAGVQEKAYLKSRDVMELLKCSESKLISLRNSGKLSFSKVQGTYYYKRQDIENLISK